MGEAEYPIPAHPHSVELVARRSRFIASLARAESAAAARDFIDSVRTELPDATHHCWAYVAGPPGSTAAVGMSDAGEPHGTAGRPMLDVLVHSGVGEVVAVVTRYYGGVKLGRGGLARAYAGAVQQALTSLPRTRRVTRTQVEVEAGYADVEAVRRALEAAGAEIVDERYGAGVRYVAAVPAARLDALESALADATAGRARMAPRNG